MIRILKLEILFFRTKLKLGLGERDKNMESKKVVNTNQLVTKAKTEFLADLNICDEIKHELDHLIDDGSIPLHEMEVFAFDKFQQLTKPYAMDVICKYKEIVKTGKISKPTQFFANMIASNQAIEDTGTELKNGFYAPDSKLVLEALSRDGGFELEISTGQRKLTPKSFPPSSNPSSDNGQCFIGSLNREAFEPELLELMSTIPNSTIKELRYDSYI